MASINPYKIEGRAPNFWINGDARKEVEWRDGDVVVSVPAKSGTTWTMNIVHQLREGGDSEFEDIYKEVTWLEFALPYQSTEEIIKQVDNMPTHRRRAFKTHGSPAECPYIEPKEGNKDVKYVCVFRNPEEACVSFYPFIGNHNPEITSLYDVPFAPFPDFQTYLDKFYFGESMGEGRCENFFSFVKEWWPKRHNKNVLFLHFSEMKQDHEGSVKKISDFLGYDYPPEQFANILEYTSFGWMKNNQIKFELNTFFKEGPFLSSGAMVRKGQSGKAKDDGMTDELSAKIRAVGVDVLGENNPALEWYYKGGPLPE